MSHAEGRMQLGRAPRCPRCRTRALESVQQDGVEIDACKRCGGLWFEHGELERALRSYDPALAGVFQRELGAARGPSERACPQCDQTLIEHEWTDKDVLRIDLCPGCSGVWLDAEELTRIQAGAHLASARTAIARPRTLAHWFFQFLTGLPVEFNFRPRRVPMVTLSLITLNVCVFLIQQGSDAQQLLDALAFHPDRAYGLHWWLELLTHNFLHANAIHLLGNLYFFYILGDNLEDLLGRRNFIGFCLGAALLSGWTETVFAADPHVPTIGFSGVVSGVLIAYAVLFRHARLTFMLFVLQWKVSILVYAGIWLAFNVAGLVLQRGAVSYLGHLGGASFGLCVALLAYRPLMRRDPLLRLLNGVRTPLSA